MCFPAPGRGEENTMKMEQLLQAMGDAVQDAHRLMEFSSMQSYLEQFFEPAKTDADTVSYQPKSLCIQLPAEMGGRTIQAPLAALVHHNSLNVDYVKLKLNIHLDEENEITVAPASPAGEQDCPSGELEIVFKGSAPPEGIARIETSLNQFL